MSLLTKTLPVLALVFASSAAAADAPPKPVTDLGCLIGNWKGKGTFEAGKDKANIQANWACKRSSAQYGVLCTLLLTGIPDLPRYEETDLFGYEPNTNTYHWYSVTNAGETHDHVAAVPAGSSAQFVFNGVQESKPFREVIDLTFADDSKSFSLRAETFVAGVSTSVIQVGARK